MVNWAIALGAGARSALNTYETLDDLERKQNADKRAERALQLQEQAGRRAEARFAREEADRQRLLGILGGGEPATLDVPTQSAGERTSALLNTPPGTTGASDGATSGSPAPSAAVNGATPTRGGATTAPASAPAQTGRGLNLGRIRGELLRGGFFNEAFAISRIQAADAQRELAQLEMAIRQDALDETKRKRAQEIYAQETERMLELSRQLPQDDNADLTPDLLPVTSAITHVAGQAKKMLPDGMDMQFEHNDDGTITVKVYDQKTGKFNSEKTLKTVGQLREEIYRAAALREPTIMAKWEAYNAINRRKAEMELADLEKTRAEALKTQEEILSARDKRIRENEMHELDLMLKNDKVRRELTESKALDTILEGLKDPGRSEESMRMAADIAGTLNPETWLKQEEEENPDGTRSKRHVNILQQFIDRVVPLQEVQTTDSKGNPVTLTVQEAAQRYAAILPQALEQSGGNPDLVIARLRQRHDQQFRRGSFDKYVAPQIIPQLQELVRQRHMQQMMEQRGAPQPSQDQQEQPQRSEGPSPVARGLSRPAIQALPQLSSGQPVWKILTQREQSRGQ